jgi:hypothetical protein
MPFSLPRWARATTDSIAIILLAFSISVLVESPFGSVGMILTIAIAPIAEELSKSFAIAFVLGKKRTTRQSTAVGLVAGLGFGIAETVLIYPSAIVIRIFTSIPLHTGTGGIDGYAVGSRRYWIIAGAIGTHSIYNSIANSGIEPDLILVALVAFSSVAVVCLYLVGSKPANHQERDTGPQ